MDHRQPLAVAAVGVGPQLVLNLVGLEVGEAAHLQNAVLRHGGVPHEVAPGLQVMDVRQQAAHIHHRVAHDGQGHIV